MESISITINGEKRSIFKGTEVRYALKVEELKKVESKEYSLYGHNDHLLTLSFIPDGREEIVLKETVLNAVIMEGIRVLIYTEDYILSAAVEARLAPLGCETRIVFNDSEASKSLRDFKPDVVVTDEADRIWREKVIKWDTVSFFLSGDKLIIYISLSQGEERTVHIKIQESLSQGTAR